ncbi:hypothetical protein F4825DRAFT_445017 [Nemania diffusa]|nr:hypothetical protein F4825DRAFT_445017 [Nemania diffusa]
MLQHDPVDSPAAQRLYTPAYEPCRWFSRCWTLQELLASRRLEFYDSQWNSIHSLQAGESIDLDEFGEEIASITRVDSDALLCKVPLWKYSVEAKMSWALSRKSGRPEDMAYSLLGIFEAAFYRLQLEIIKSTPDLSLFAWHSGNNLTDGQFCSMLASCPSQFRFHRRICRSIPESHYTMTNKGIQITCIVHRIRKRDKERYFLCLEDEEETNSAVGIFLRKISYDVYERRKESLSEIGNIRSQPSALPTGKTSQINSF